MYQGTYRLCPEIDDQDSSGNSDKIAIIAGSVAGAVVLVIAAILVAVVGT